MRKGLLIIALTIGLTNCTKMERGQAETTDMPIQDLELGAVVQDSLTTEQLADISRIHEVFADVSSSSLEQTIIDFRRDQHPDREIAIWLNMADAYKRFTQRTDREIDSDKKNEAFELILLRSMMTEDEVLDKLELKVLTEEEAKEILKYYAEIPEPVTVVRK